MITPSDLNILENTAICMILVLAISGCKKNSSGPSDDPNSWFVATYNMYDMEVTDLYDGPIVLGTVENKQIDEASGIAVSRQHPQHVWTHNDSGDHNRIFLVGPSGEDRGTFRIENTGNRDWEDMAIGPGPEAEIDYLYISDIGDNLAQHAIKRVFRLPEPDVTEYADVPGVPWLPAAEMIQFTYPGGPVDAETFMIDPITKDFFVVTKRAFPTKVFIARYPQKTDEVFEIELLGTLPFTEATAGDISPDGSRILIKTKTHVYMWSRNPGEPIRDAFLRSPVRIPYYPEPQGEAIGWSPDGKSYFTISESRSVPVILYRYDEK